MSQRFYVPEPILPDGDLTITGDEHHHLFHVMRCQPGDKIVLFDNSGYEYPATIQSISKKNVIVSVGSRVNADRELGFCLTIAMPLPKSDRQKFLIEKLTELGVTRFVPLTTSRSIVDPKEKVLTKLDRLVVEASKQCGRNRKMIIGSACSLESFCNGQWQEAVPPEPNGVQKWVASTSGEKLSMLNGPGQQGNSQMVLIGPEGGFSPAEINLAIDSEWTPVSLGNTILRMETAAVFAASVLRLA